MCPIFLEYRSMMLHLFINITRDEYDIFYLWNWNNLNVICHSEYMLSDEKKNQIKIYVDQKCTWNFKITIDFRQIAFYVAAPHDI